MSETYDAQTPTIVTPQILLGNHLRALKLPTFTREYDKMAMEAAQDRADNRQRLDAQMRRLGEQLLAGAGAAQERKMRGHLQLGIARPSGIDAVHPNIPCK